MGWFQFRLRTLLIVTAVVAVLAFVWARHRRRQQQLERRQQPAIFSEAEFELWLRDWDDEVPDSSG